MDYKFTRTDFKEAIIIEPKFFPDDRGFFIEFYNAGKYKEGGIHDVFIQDNFSVSKKGVLRGLHFQKTPHEISKLVQCIQGEIFDVIVDIRPQSPTFRHWQGFVLSEKNRNILYVPKGFAHGFCAMDDHVAVLYKVDESFYPESDGSVRWNDPSINVKWPIESPILSEKDKNAPFLKDVIV